jgi:hypothetical protein
VFLTQIAVRQNSQTGKQAGVKTIRRRSSPRRLRHHFSRIQVESHDSQSDK